MKKFLLLLGMLISSFVLPAQNTAQIGTATTASATTLYSPIYRFSSTSTNRFSRSNIVYTAAELNAVGITSGSIIQSIAFYKTNTEATNANPLNMRVYMANSTTAPPLATTTTWASILSSHTQVYANSNQVIPPVVGWITLTLQTPFIYTGGSLEIAIDSDISGTSPFSTGAFAWQYTAGSAGSIVGNIGSTAPTTLSATTAAYKERPNIQITYSSSAGICANNYSGFNSSNVTTTGAQINWTPGTGNNSFFLEYGLSGFTKGSGTKITGSYPGAQPPVSLSGLQPGTAYQVYLGEICNNGSDSTFAQAPIQFTTAPLCLVPTGITVGSVTANSAVINFSGSGSDYDVEWGVSGFTPGSGCLTNYTGLSGTLTISNAASPTCNPILPQTTYQFYLRQNCSTAGNGTSAWAGPFSFTTSCGTLMAPYLETFSSGFNAGAFGPNLSQCFKSKNTTIPRWEVEDATGANENSLSTGPFWDNTSFGTVGGMYLYFEVSGGSLGSADTLTGPWIDVANLSQPFLQFAYHMYGATMGDLEVEYWDGTQWTMFTTISGQQQTAGADPWRIYGDYINMNSGTLTRFRFIGVRGTDFYGDMSLDDIQIINAPPCPNPANVKIASRTASSVNIQWNNVSGGNWSLEWGPVGFVQGTGTTINTSSNSVNISSGLQSNTTYHYYIRRNCGTNGTSSWVGPLSFTTLCAPFTAPYSNNFDSDPANAVPACWYTVNKVAGTTKGAINTLTTITPQSAPNHVRIYNGSGVATANDSVILISPEFSDLPLGDRRIQFYAKASTAGTQLVVGTLSSPLQGGSFDAVDTITLTTTHTLYVINITAANGYVGGHNYIGFFHNNTATLRTIYVDNFLYEQIPSCPGSLSSTLNVSNITAASAQANWSGGQGDTTLIEWGLPGFTPGTGTEVGSAWVSGSATSFIISGLMPQTTYQFFIRDSCAAAGWGQYVGPVNFSTLCAPTAMPYYESFDVWPLACWTNTGTSPWLSYAAGTDLYARANFWSVSTGNYILTSLPVAITQDAQIRFKWSHLYSTSYPDDQLLVLVKRLSDTQYDTVLDLIGPVNFNDPGAGNTTPGQFTTEEIILDPTKYTGDTIVVRLWANTDFGPDLFINDFYIEDAPPCPPLTSLNISNITSAGADFSWSGAGSASTYEVWYGPQGFYQGSATVGGTKVTLNATNFNIPGLSPQTCYEVLVRANCGPVNGPWTGPVSFCTACLSQMSGVYTIGGAAGPNNFADFTSAAKQLNDCGVSGPVQLQVISGTYTEQFELTNVVGISAANTITIMPHPANSNPAIITFASTSTTDNYVIKLTDMAYVNIQGLTLTNSGSLYSRVIDLTGNGAYIRVENNIINGKTAANSSSQNFALISNNTTSGSIYNNCVFKHNTLNGGSFGIYLYGFSATSRESNNIVDSNTVLGYSWSGISINYQNNARVRGNHVNSGTTNGTTYGIYSLGNEGYIISGNEVYAKATATTYGLYADGDPGLATNPNYIYNNMIGALNNTGTAYGIYLYNNSYNNVLHNSVLVSAGSATAGRTMYLNTSSSTTYNNNAVINNSFVNMGPGVAVEVSTNASSGYISQMNYNNLYASGALLGRFGTATAANLAAWKTASGLDAASVSGNPIYVANEDLHVIGGILNDAATPLTMVTTDIDGQLRSATTPDIGADEYTPVSGDLSLIKGVFIKGKCLSANDSIVLSVYNQVGPVIDFSVDPLTVNYSVSGPVNTSGSTIINTGTLNSLDTLQVYIPGINMSQAGIYTLNASINPNAVNNLSLNDNLNPAKTLEVKVDFQTLPAMVTLANAQDSVELCVESSFFNSGNGFFISEVVHYKYTVGAPVAGWPSYLLADDYIEVTGVPGSDMEGIVLEQWSTTALMNTHTFPAGTLIGPNGTAIIAVGQPASSVPSPANFYYHGNVSSTFSSGGNNGRILKDANGNIIDAVGVGATYTFPAASGVTATDWSGFSGNHSTMSGVRLTGPDLNNASNWVLSSVMPQDPNVVNANVPVPTPQATTGLQWTLAGVPVDTASCIMAGPYTAAGTYYYVATYTNSCGTFTDTSIVVVPNPIFNDAKLSAIVLPTSDCGDSTTMVKVAFQNLGINAINSLPVSVNVSGAVNATLNAVYNGNVAQYAYDTLSVGTINTVNGGTLNFSATLSLTGDQDISNDNMLLSSDFVNTLAPVPTVAIDTLCGAGNMDTLFFPLGSTDEFYWLDSNGDTIGTTDSLIVGPLNAMDTTFYLMAKAGATYQVGPLSNTIGAAANFTDPSFQQLYFTALQDFTLKYVTVYPNANGNVNINLVDFTTNAIIKTVTVAVTGVTAPGTMQRIAVNMDIPAGTYKMHGGGSTTGGLWRNSAGAVYPYTVPGVVSITGNSFATGGAYYYYFYDWEVSTGGCAKALGSVTIYNSGNTTTAAFTSVLGTPGSSGMTVSFDGSTSQGGVTYNWNFGDGTTAMGVSPQHTYTANGSYQVSLTVTGPCGTATITQTVVINGIGLVETIAGQQLHIYPVPVKSTVTLKAQFNSSALLVLRLMDMSGRELMRVEYTNHNGDFVESLDLSHLPKGVYMIELGINDHRIHRRLVKE